MTPSPYTKVTHLLAWIGDGVLTLAALIVGLTHRGPFDAAFLVPLVLAVFLGACLPLFAYGIDYLHARQAARAAEVSAPETLRDALAQIARLTSRIETAATDAAKTTLSARQLPSLLKEQALALSSASTSMIETARSHPASSAPVENEVASAETAAHLATILERLEGLREQLAAQATAAAASAEPATVDLSPLLARLDGLEARWQERTASPAPTPSEPPPTEVAPVAPPVVKKRRATPPKKPAPAPDDLFGALAPELPGDRATLQVKALVGVSNSIYVRGDAPLSWDRGRPLEAIGIGEWRIDLEGVTEDLACEIRLNDQIPAKGAGITLTPGQITRTEPVFPAPSAEAKTASPDPF